MPVDVISKFTTLFWIKAVVFTIFIFTSITACIIVSIKHWFEYNWGQLTLIVIFSIVLVYFFLNLAINSLVRVTIAPEGLCVKYLITKKLIIIAYADITHLSNVRISNNSENATASSYVEFKIKLDTGEEFSFTDNQFENYHELKRAISEYRQINRVHNDITS